MVLGKGAEIGEKVKAASVCLSIECMCAVVVLGVNCMQCVLCVIGVVCMMYVIMLLFWCVRDMVEDL